MFSIGLSEIVLIVDDVKASARFYQDVVGLTPEIEADDEWAWFWAGPVGQAQKVGLRKGSLLLKGLPALPGGERWGQVHYAFNVPRAQLEEAVQHVRRQNVEVYGPVYWEWMKAEAYYFYDLDGNLLEFWSPTPE